jgi:hypothetical protein
MFDISTNHENPPKNIMIFEEYFGKYISLNKPKLKREYLPIYWTNYYISKNYGQDDTSDLQRYLDSLDRSKRYFTIVQWDDGILNKIHDLDLLIFSSGGMGDYPIPLNSYFYCNAPNISIEKRRFLCSFVGAIYGRHSVREIMTNELKDKPNVVITDKRYDYNSYLNIMNQTVFSLCPRGYGKTSFRIYEALMCHSIPVYIYDHPWVPYFDNFEEYGVLCHVKDIFNLYDKLANMTEKEINNKINNGIKTFIEKYTYEATTDYIIKMMEK